MPKPLKPASAFESRISAGILKGKKIILPNNDAARPTRLRLRQAVLNMLVSRVELAGLNVVDLCCGSGALGLETYSRGAAQVTLVDAEVVVARRNVDALGVRNDVNVVQADARTWNAPSPFNIILADPPYGSGIAQGLLARRAQFGKPGSWWVVEVGADEVLDWADFAEVRENVYGISKIGIGRQR
jgi:16S rRNA (guanine966-N2)-methyltransferase